MSSVEFCLLFFGLIILTVVTFKALSAQLRMISQMAEIITKMSDIVKELKENKGE